MRNRRKRYIQRKWRLPPSGTVTMNRDTIYTQSIKYKTTQTPTQHTANTTAQNKSFFLSLSISLSLHVWIFAAILSASWRGFCGSLQDQGQLHLVTWRNTNRQRKTQKEQDTYRHSRNIPPPKKEFRN